MAGYCLAEVLNEAECKNMIGKFITNKIEIIDVCKTNNRGILGSMNDMIAHSKFYLSEYQLTSVEIATRLNEMPYSYLNYENPLAVIKQMALS